MTDNGHAALAAALHAQMPWRYDTYEPEDEIGPINSRLDAAAILGERGVFLPDGLPHDCQTSIRLNQGMAETNERLASEITEQAATIATLRAALELAHDHHLFGPRDGTPANCSAEAALADYRPHPDRRTEW